MALFCDDRKIPKTLRERFLVPPFSILDAKNGYWADRKRAWERILQDRADNVRDIVARSNTPYINQFDNDEFRGMKSPGAGDISTFDPFLCEILIKWFSTDGMTIFDPFAGGIVRGGVATILNRKYIGVDISPAQIEHDVRKWNEIKGRYSDIAGSPTYLFGDARNAYTEKDSVDMILMCPPYYNLEIYTNNPHDLSNAPTYNSFLSSFACIVKMCYNVLKDNSFAAVVVEEIRDKNGIMYGFVPDVIKTFMDCGFLYYNEMILENRVVSLGVRCTKYFVRSRKVGRHHQNILVFYKGDVKTIENKFKEFT